MVPLRAMVVTTLDPSTCSAHRVSDLAPAMARLRKNRWLPARKRPSSTRAGDSRPMSGAAGCAGAGWWRPGCACGGRRPSAGPGRRARTRRSGPAPRRHVGQQRPGHVPQEDEPLDRGRRLPPEPGHLARPLVDRRERPGAARLVLDHEHRRRRPDGAGHGHDRRRGGWPARGRTSPPDRRRRRRPGRRPTPRPSPPPAPSGAAGRTCRPRRWPGRSGGSCARPSPGTHVARPARCRPASARPCRAGGRPRRWPRRWRPRGARRGGSGRPPARGRRRPGCASRRG